MNLKKLTYPGDAIRFDVEVLIDGDQASVPFFVFTVLGNDYEIGAEDFELADGDTVLVTPEGLELVGEEDDDSTLPIFPETGSRYWLLSRSGDELLQLEVAR